VENKKIINIITKSFADVLSDAEQDSLDLWVSESIQNKRKYAEYKRLWEQAKILATHDEIDVEKALIDTKGKIKEFKTKKGINFWVPRAAAAVLLLFSLAFGFDYFSNAMGFSETETQTVLQEVKAMHGTRTKLLLADGSGVWLNSGSILRFPISFDNLNERKVELIGEGYFEVSKNAEKPFIVKTSDIDVKVYGTAFNVSAYGEDDATIVALVEGKVSLEKESQGGREELAVLAPNEVVEFSKKNLALHRIPNVKMAKYTGWREGYMVFYGDPIDVVTQRLEKWFNISIEIDKALENYRFTATIQNESLEQVLELLSMSSPMHYEIEPAKLKEDNTYSPRKVKLAIN
tara:strand:- start:111501 stop:112544 length:1044 start_codon:yes stop_codon:yes gene_type:complete